MKKPEEEVEHGPGMERWLLTYADMITLLLIFFIILYASSSISQGKMVMISQALSVVFGGGGEGVLTGDVGVLQYLRLTPSGQRVREAYAETVSKLQDEMGEKKVRINITNKGIRVSLSSDFYFTSGSPEFDPAALQVLEKVRSTIAEIPNKILVEGHTDNQPIIPGGELSRRYPTNWELSSQRAINVVHYFQKNNIPADRLSTAAYGETRPIKPNDTQENRSFNRRVEIYILYN